MPIPVSITENRTVFALSNLLFAKSIALSDDLFGRAICKEILPSDVNLNAFARKFLIICSTLCSSVLICSGNPSAISIFKVIPFSLAMCWKFRFMLLQKSFKYMSSIWRSILPDSTFERSSTSLISSNKSLPDELIELTDST